jgi:drug/metabolite transporter (DMT)-like permease
MFASVLFLAGLAAWEGFFDAVPRFTPGGWLAVLFIGASSGLGYYLWLWALRHTTATEVTVYLALGPVTATALGALLLAEPVSLLFLIGLGCVALGVWLAHRRPR